jgi:tetratricopeptide (TPR) repeat protein
VAESRAHDVDDILHTEIPTWEKQARLEGRALLCLAEGDRDGAERAWRERVRLAAQGQDAYVQLSPLRDEGHRLELDGDLEGAVAAAARLIARGDELGSAVAARLGAYNFAFRPLLHLGRPEEALASALGARQRGGWTDRRNYFRVGEQGLCLAHQGDTTAARAQLADDLAHVTISPDTPIRVLSSLLEAAVILEERAAAALLAPLLADVRAFPFPLKSVALLVGRAAALLGDRAGAMAHYERSLAWATTIRFRSEVGLTRLAMAELLLDEAINARQSIITAGDGQGKLTGDKLTAEGLAHLDFAIEEFRAMKMQPHLERALSHKGLLKA